MSAVIAKWGERNSVGFSTSNFKTTIGLAEATRFQSLVYDYHIAHRLVVSLAYLSFYFYEYARSVRLGAGDPRGEKKEQEDGGLFQAYCFGRYIEYQAAKFALIFFFIRVG